MLVNFSNLRANTITALINLYKGHVGGIPMPLCAVMKLEFVYEYFFLK